MAFGVYVHIPYCMKKCPYCDFNSYGVGDRVPAVEYTETLLRELDFYSGEMGSKILTSIFFGGGTPSLFSPDSIGMVISKIFDVTSPSSDIEITLEVNPKTADLEKLAGLRRAGVNRISVGVQSFSGRKLRFLGRINSPADGRRILEDVVDAGFSNFSFDLIYGTRDETLSEWKTDLEEAVRFGSKHISAYCLTIENGTEFGWLFNSGKLTLPEDEDLARFISFTKEFLEPAGYGQYEISNYSLPGYECRHNLLYWRGEDYIGIGAGAHSHLSRTDESKWGKRWGNLRNPSLYMKAVGQGRRPVDFSENLSRQEAMEDDVIMGFRLKDGIDFSYLYGKYGVKPDLGRIECLREDGFIELSEKSIRLTKKGNLLSDEIVVRLVSSLG